MDKIQKIHFEDLILPIIQPVEGVFVRVKNFALSDKQDSRRKGPHQLTAGGKRLLQDSVFLPQFVHGLSHYQGMILCVSYGMHDNQAHEEKGYASQTIPGSFAG